MQDLAYKTPSWTGVWVFLRENPIPSFAVRQGHLSVCVSGVIAQLLLAAAPLCQFLPICTQI